MTWKRMDIELQLLAFALRKMEKGKGWLQAVQIVKWFYGIGRSRIPWFGKRFCWVKSMPFVLVRSRAITNVSMLQVRMESIHVRCNAIALIDSNWRSSNGTLAFSPPKFAWWNITSYFEVKELRTPAVDGILFRKLTPGELAHIALQVLCIWSRKVFTRFCGCVEPSIAPISKQRRRLERIVHPEEV